VEQGITAEELLEVSHNEDDANFEYGEERYKKADW
jgi:hypothetical protein